MSETIKLQIINTINSEDSGMNKKGKMKSVYVSDYINRQRGMHERDEIPTTMTSYYLYI